MSLTLIFTLAAALIAWLILLPTGVLVVLPEGQQRSGSAGGSVWSRNRYGAYVRNRSVPVNPNTDRQGVVRNSVKALTIAWQNTLTQAQRDAWDVYAKNVSWLNKLGQPVNLTGLNHYVRSNAPRALCSLARLDAAPTVFNLAAAELNLSCVASEAAQTLVFSFDDTADWCSEDGAFQIFSMGMPQNASIKYFGGPFRFTVCLPGDSVAPQTSPAAPVATPDWPFAADQRVWIQSRIGRADGRLSELARANFLCVA